MREVGVVVSVTLMFISITAAIVVIIVTGHLTESSAATLVLLVGLFAPTIAALMAHNAAAGTAKTVERNTTVLDRVEKTVNGHFNNPDSPV